MKKFLLLFFLLVGFAIHAQVKVGDNPTTIGNSSVLELESTNKALVLTRVATVSAIATPVNGMLVYDISSNCVKAYENGVWSTCLSSGTTSSGTIATLDCAGATNNGTLTAGTAASSVSSVIAYTGGNGGTHSGQTVSSTGVTGLTATLASGSFASGNGNLTYNITGTPSGAGTASFAISIGGQSCTLNRTVVAAAGSIASLDCAGATNNGTLTEGTAASGVSSVIAYTGGNGGTHSGQTVTSTGVTGLTATLASGSFVSGNGNLTYNITGTPSGSGTASFAISIGGQSCTLNRTVAANTPSYSAGSGSFSGKICFDVAISNNNTNNCGLLSARTPQKADFTQAATHTQSYTFTPSGTVSNVRFQYVNTNGSVITAISGNNTGNNISTAVVATVNYNTSLNTLATGLTNANPLTADIYVIYNDGATNNGTNRQLKLTANVKDCSCCGAPTSAGGFLAFMCHNLGADQSVDPFTPGWKLNGAYFQWGKKPADTNSDGYKTKPHNGPEGFAAAPTGPAASEANSTLVSSWSVSAAGSTSWNVNEGSPAKTANDPCPSGYRVPTRNEWVSIYSTTPTNTTTNWSNVGTYSLSTTNYSSGKNVNNSLFLPASGNRSSGNGQLSNRGNEGTYWSSTLSGTKGYSLVFNSSSVYPANNYNDRLFAFSVRCVAE